VWGSRQNGTPQNKNNAATLQIVAYRHDLVWPLGLLNIDSDQAAGSFSMNPENARNLISKHCKTNVYHFNQEQGILVPNVIIKRLGVMLRFINIKQRIIGATLPHLTLLISRVVIFQANEKYIDSL